MSSEIKIEVSLDLKTCNCGTVYAVPDWLSPYRYRCPLCSLITINEKESKNSELQKEIKHLKRVIIGLRGRKI